MRLNEIHNREPTKVSGYIGYITDIADADIEIIGVYRSIEDADYVCDQYYLDLRQHNVGGDAYVASTIGGNLNIVYYLKDASYSPTDIEWIVVAPTTSMVKMITKKLADEGKIYYDSKDLSSTVLGAHDVNGLLRVRKLSRI